MKKKEQKHRDISVLQLGSRQLLQPSWPCQEKLKHSEQRTRPLSMELVFRNVHIASRYKPSGCNFVEILNRLHPNSTNSTNHQEKHIMEQRHTATTRHVASSGLPAPANHSSHTADCWIVQRRGRNWRLKEMATTFCLSESY